MTRTNWMAGAALSISMAVSTGTANAAEAANPMLNATSQAIASCVALNADRSVTPVRAIADGLGDWIVWLQDTDRKMWACNVNSRGDVFANVRITGDLVDGEGDKLISYGMVSNRVRDDGQPVRHAQRLCASIGGLMEDMRIVATVSDGMGDYVVWLQNRQKGLWLCNASADAKLYVFESVRFAINRSGVRDGRFRFTGPPRSA